MGGGGPCPTGVIVGAAEGSESKGEPLKELGEKREEKELEKRTG